ncbi:MAG: hypothetical protein JWQ03_1226 [Variovorax sp.]|nr:hypothetical protein [Variovorax sp.]
MTSPPLGHHFRQVTQAQLETQIPPDTQDDDFTLEVPALEQFVHALQPLRHRSAFSSKATACPGRDLHQSQRCDGPSNEAGTHTLLHLVAVFCARHKVVREASHALSEHSLARGIQSGCASDEDDGRERTSIFL